MDQRHLHLIEICEAIGGVAECNGQFTAGLAIMLGGRTIEEMTVGELIAAIAVRTELYNKYLAMADGGLNGDGSQHRANP